MGNPQDLMEGAVGIAATGIGLGLMAGAAGMTMRMMQRGMEPPRPKMEPPKPKKKPKKTKKTKSTKRGK
jgi:hypothetical protein